MAKAAKPNREQIENQNPRLASIPTPGGPPPATMAYGSSLAAGAVVLFSLLVRALVSMGHYSGEGLGPKFGDYEAQRHWMEMTLNLPVSEWYRNSSVNDLSYWGLDYPPLSAYQSLAHALLLNASVPEAVALFSSRGFESPKSKLMMRWTVLSSDLLAFFPAALYFVWAYARSDLLGVRIGRDGSILWLLTIVLLNPCLILIDHGHFQYNCISLGLTLGAIAAVLSRNELVAAFLFSLAINHKQMSLYFAPAFFGHLLGKCLKCKHPILEITKLGTVVVATFTLVWWPYLHSPEAFFEVVSRLAPFERGIYEDYVANFWCSTSILVKWKLLFPIPSLKLLSLTATVAAFSPSLIQQVVSPSNAGFLFSLLNSSFAFFLFSYQVHEKSILLPLLPASLLALREPLLYGWFAYYSLLSLYPLICRDNLLLQYIAILSLFVHAFHAPFGHSPAKPKGFYTRREFAIIPLAFSMILHVVYLSVQPPKRYPFIFEALMMILSFSQFAIFTIYANYRQWMLPGSSRPRKKQL